LQPHPSLLHGNARDEPVIFFVPYLHLLQKYHHGLMFAPALHMVLQLCVLQFSQLLQ
jgi:hypothetical protein